MASSYRQAHSLLRHGSNKLDRSRISRKVEKVRKANCSHLLLLVYQGLNITEKSFGDVASEIIFFQQKPVVKDVIATIDVMAERLYGPRIPSRRKKRP